MNVYIYKTYQEIVEIAANINFQLKQRDDCLAIYTILCMINKWNYKIYMTYME